MALILQRHQGRPTSQKLSYERIETGSHLSKYNVPVEKSVGGLDAEDLYQKISSRITQLECNLAATSRHEGEHTRQHVSEELAKTKEELKTLIEQGQLTIVDCIKYNATKNIQLICVYAALISAFTLVVSILLGVQLVNPFLAILLLIGSMGFFLMTKVAQGKSCKE